MTKRDSKELTPTELAALKDDLIDTSDIADLDGAFRKNVQLVEPEGTAQVTRGLRSHVTEIGKTSCLHP